MYMLKDIEIIWAEYTPDDFDYTGRTSSNNERPGKYWVRVECYDVAGFIEAIAQQHSRAIEKARRHKRYTYRHEQQRRQQRRFRFLPPFFKQVIRLPIRNKRFWQTMARLSHRTGWNHWADMFLEKAPSEPIGPEYLTEKQIAAIRETT